MIKNYNQFIDRINNLKKVYLENGFSQENVNLLSEGGYFNDIKYKDNDTLFVFRSITLLESEIDEFKNDVKENIGIGIYWSFDNEIRSIWGNNVDYRNDNKEKTFDVLSTGILKIKDIDFVDLLYAFNEDCYSNISEKEVRGKNYSKTILIIDYKINER